MSDKDTSSPVLPIKGHDPRTAKYEAIARYHRQIVEAKYRALTTHRPFALKPEIVLHLEESLAFLAEELLELRAAVEKLEERA